MFIQQRSIHKLFFYRLFRWDHSIRLGIISLYHVPKEREWPRLLRVDFGIALRNLWFTSLEWVSGCKVRSSGKCKLHCAIRWHRRVRLQRRQRRQLHIVMHEAVSATAAPYQCPRLRLRRPHTGLTRWIQLGHSVNTLRHTNIFSRFSLLVIKLNSKTKKNNNNNDGGRRRRQACCSGCFCS